VTPGAQVEFLALTEKLGAVSEQPTSYWMRFIEMVPDDRRLDELRRLVDSETSKRHAKAEAARQFEEQRVAEQAKKFGAATVTVAEPVTVPESVPTEHTTSVPTNDTESDAATKARRAGYRSQHPDPRGVSWHPRRDGNVNVAVFRPFDPVPDYVVQFLIDMSGVEAKAYVALMHEADRNGEFRAPRGWLAKMVGTTDRIAGEALSTFEEAGLITVLYSGGKQQATVWRMPTRAEFDVHRARETFQARREAGAAHAQKRRDAGKL
jgi:hypothetical protein